MKHLEAMLTFELDDGSEITSFDQMSQDEYGKLVRCLGRPVTFMYSHLRDGWEISTERTGIFRYASPLA